MNKETATELLLSLLERARISREATFLTSREIAALAAVLQVRNEQEATAPAEKPKPQGPLVRLPAVPDGEITREAMLCIDFGTSFSKAFACVDNGDTIPEIVDLPIGKFGGGDSQLITPSEMLIDDGKIFFGGHARKLFDDTEASPERLISSIKQYMTLGADVTHLSKIRVDTAKDPEQRFFQRDILLLYLAHLTRLTEKALESKGHSINLRRRFAHPAWSDGHRKNNEQEMKLLMAEAIVLARSLGDQLTESCSVEIARSALDELKQINGGLPLNLIAEPIREATAAGAGALLGAAKQRREAYIILDIGAGTTDVAGCYRVTDDSWDRPRVFEVTSAADAIKSAGNVLDNALTRFILNKAGLISGSAEYRAAASFLARGNRIYKERLFDQGQFIIELPTGEAINLTVQEFLAYEPVVGFENNLRKLVVKAALAVAGDMKEIVLVATGGGAKLPIVKKIADEGVHQDGIHIKFKWRDPAPEGMAASYPDLIDPYPQIAVAVGGALPLLPEQRANVSSGLTGAPKHVAAAAIYKS